jgi:hypothetical protein
MELSPEQSAQLESFENRRNYPRLNMQLPVTVTGPDGKKVKGTICNMSPGGAQILYSGIKGKDVIHPLTAVQDQTKSGRCTLKFDLSYVNAVTMVKIGASPVYTRPVDEDGYVCGMIFSEKKLTENKKISDFLFHQLQESFAELEDTREINPAAMLETGVVTHQTIIEKTRKESMPAETSGLGKELDALIVQLTEPKHQLEAVKQILINILSSLKANQELTRHIDERIYLVLQKLSWLS